MSIAAEHKCFPQQNIHTEAKGAQMYIQACLGKINFQNVDLRMGTN